jgi:hypothetical protein
MSLFFMKNKLLKVFSSSITPNTCTLIILATFKYSLSLWTKMIWSNLQLPLSKWVHVFCFPHHSFNIITHVEFEKNACNLNHLESKSGGTTTPLFVFFATQNVSLIKWGKKDLIVASLHTTYYIYIKLSTSQFKVKMTSKHASFTILTMIF